MSIFETNTLESKKKLHSSNQELRYLIFVTAPWSVERRNYGTLGTTTTRNDKLFWDCNNSKKITQVIEFSDFVSCLVTTPTPF